jgi:hypothetical protein
MKKLFAGFMAAVMSIFLIGCRDQKPKETSTDSIEDAVVSATTASNTAGKDQSKTTAEGASDVTGEIMSHDSQKPSESGAKPLDGSVEAAAPQTPNASATVKDETSAGTQVATDANANEQTKLPQDLQDLDNSTMPPVTSETAQQDGPKVDEYGNDEL